MNKKIIILAIMLAGAWNFVIGTKLTFAGNVYQIEQLSADWLILDSHINDSDPNWPKDIIALGPHKWTTRICLATACDQGGQLYATETWQAPTTITNCHKTPTLCRPPRVNGGVIGNNSKFGQWLWGYGSESDPKQSLYEYKVLPSSNQLLNSSNTSACRYNRGVGPGVAWEGKCDGTLAIYNSGAYGWGFGSVTRSDPTTDGPSIVGFQMPLQWDVEGTYAPPPPQGGE